MMLTKNKRLRKLPDAPLVGEHYMNGTSEYVVRKLGTDFLGLYAIVERPKDLWHCTAHLPALYEMDDGSIELLWSHSTDGQFGNPGYSW